MGNTQHSLLNGHYNNPSTDRGKTQSPFTSKRGLLTSKSPTGREDRLSDSNGTPANKRNSELKVSASLKTKLKNSILSSSMTPSNLHKEQNADKKIGNMYLQIDYSSLSNNDLSSGNEIRKSANDTNILMHANSTRSENRKFTFDPSDIHVRKNFQRSQELIDEPASLPHEEWLKNLNPKASEVYDYLLTILDSPLHFIKNDDSLQIITPPDRQMICSIASANSNFSPINSDHMMMMQLTLEDFELIKVIGKGGFSKVFQVRKKDTGKIYAMKTLSKSKIKRDNKVENILNERAILEKVSHPFIVQMKYAFQNDDYLFLLLEFCAGGELFFRLNNIPQGRMTEKQAKFYFAEILEAIQYLHDNDILYRDLKPENIVLDEQGHAKLTDFGLSKLQFKQRDRAYSFCGSPEYMAPEMLATERNRMVGNTPMYHNRCLDFYHLGALLFEILCGLPPFFSEDRQKMYKDIMFSAIQIPSYLSNECRSLLKGLLQKNPEKRLGSERGCAEIKEHPWCADIDWNLVAQKKIEPPFKPFMNKSNFDPEYTAMDPILQDDDPLLSLDEISQQKPAVFLDEYENRIAKQKTKNQQQEQKMSRQHSIELYARENNTFRGYSFLQDNNNQQTQNGFDQEGFYFCIADSKDQSFTGLGSPIGEFECLSDSVNQRLQSNQAQIKSPPDQELVMMLEQEQKNQHSDLSILTEGMEAVKTNMNMMTCGSNTDWQSNTMKVQKEDNSVKEKEKMHQQQSKESLYNELLSTFDYSVNKKDRNMDQVKKGNNNQTNSSVSLFSLNQHKQYLNTQNDRQSSKARHQNKEKSKNEKSFTEKLEFHKVSRKYSPEIDLERALLQIQHKQTSLQNQSAQKHIQSRLKQQISGYSEHISTRGNSSTCKNKNSKAQQQQFSDYNTVGNTNKIVGHKVGSKGRTSEKYLSQGQSSPNSVSLIQSNRKSQNLQQQKNYFNSVLKPSHQSQALKQQQTMASNFTSTWKTSQLYSQVQSKVSKKKRNLSNQQDQKLQHSSINHINEEECKIEANYQTLQPHNLKTDSSGKFIVEKITPNEFLGSFLSSSSNNQQLIVTNLGENGIFETANIKEPSFDENSKEAMAALILNQSHESCCCSDDEFTNKYNTSKGNLLGGNPTTKQSQRNLRKIQNNALQESILANQNKHKANEMLFKKELEEKKIQSNGDGTSFLMSRESFQNERSEQLAPPIHIEEMNDNEKVVKNYKTQASLIERHSIQPKAFDTNHLTVTPLSMSKKQSTQANITQQKLGSSGKVISLSSSIQSILNKTTPISPLRDRFHIGGSKLKERPSITGSKDYSLGGLGLQTNIINTPKSGKEGRNGLIQNKLSHAVGKLQKKDINK